MSIPALTGEDHEFTVSLNGTERTLTLPLLRAKPGLARAQSDAEVACGSLSDEQLLARIRARDESAALALFRRYDRLALSVGYRILQDEGEAEDLVQEIFLRLFSESDTFDSAKGSARTWLMGLQFRWELFNALNHPSFSAPNNDPSIPGTFAKITSVGPIAPRVMQGALKLSF